MDSCWLVSAVFVDGGPFGGMVGSGLVRFRWGGFLRSGGLSSSCVTSSGFLGFCGSGSVGLIGMFCGGSKYLTGSGRGFCPEMISLALWRVLFLMLGIVFLAWCVTAARIAVICFLGILNAMLGRGFF